MKWQQFAAPKAEIEEDEETQFGKSARKNTLAAGNRLGFGDWKSL